MSHSVSPPQCGAVYQAALAEDNLTPTLQQLSHWASQPYFSSNNFIRKTSNIPPLSPLIPVTKTHLPSPRDPIPLPPTMVRPSISSNRELHPQPRPQL